MLSGENIEEIFIANKDMVNLMEDQMATLNSKAKFKELLHKVDPTTNDETKFEIYGVHMFLQKIKESNERNYEASTLKPSQSYQSEPNSSPTEPIQPTKASIGERKNTPT